MTRVAKIAVAADYSGTAPAPRVEATPEAIPAAPDLYARVRGLNKSTAA